MLFIFSISKEFHCASNDRQTTTKNALNFYLKYIVMKTENIFFIKERHGNGKIV